MVYFRIFRLCLLILFLELMLIRWISTEINIFAYLQNSILVSCFLGLGMGLIAHRKSDSVRQCLAPLAVLAVLLNVPGIREACRQSSTGFALFHDFLIWGWNTARGGMAGAVILVTASLFIVLVILGTCWAAMVPLGAQLAALLSAAPRRLTAYSSDIAGSLCGVLVFTLMSYLSLPPLAWFVVLIAFLLTMKELRNVSGLAVLFIIGVLSLIGARAGSAKIALWTPYQKIEIHPAPTEGEWEVKVNNLVYQNILDNSFENPIPFLQRAIHQYNAPSRAARPVRSALVVGAGTGNDVAGVLRNSGAHVTAVDIDPVLLEQGRILHPEQPYSHERVTLVENDARAVFTSAVQGSFDLIVFGLLDSHTTPNLSNARLDNFVYTLESIRAAKRLLTPDGVLFVIFAPQRDYVTARLRNTLWEVFGAPPLTFDVPITDAGAGGVAFVTGDLSRIKKNLETDAVLNAFISEYKHEFNEVSPNVTPTSDNWPYLYVPTPSVPVVFILLAGMFLLLWIISSKRRYGRIIAPDLRRREDTFYFLLGMAFSLVQVFSINKAAILFGSTWFVNSAVIAGILLMILLSNVLASTLPSRPLLYGALLGVLSILLAALPLSYLLALPVLPRAIAGGLISGLPMLLSGILFGGQFKNSTDPGAALGANLFGAMLGGILQLMTFRFGISSLMIVAGVCYVAAGWRGRKTECAELPAPTLSEG